MEKRYFSKYFNKFFTVTRYFSDNDWYFKLEGTDVELKAQSPLSVFQEETKPIVVGSKESKPESSESGLEPKPTDKTIEDIVTTDKRFKKGVDYDYAELKYRGTPTISSDNRLWKEFEKVNICGCTRVCYGHDNLRKDIWNWILTHAKEIGNLI